MGAPPRLAVWLLTKRLPPEECDDVIGDLDEDFADRCERLGDRAAEWWYVRQALHLAWTVTPRKTRPDELFPERRRRDAESLWRDVRLAARRLLRQPLVSALSIATLAGSIGAVTATWSFLDATLLNPVPAFRADRLAEVGVRALSGRADGSANLAVRWNTAHALLDSEAFGQTAMYGTWDVTVSDGVTETKRTLGIASPNVFRVLGVPVSAGRDFTADDDRAGAPAVALVSNRFWRTALRRDSNLIGSRLTANGQIVTIVGVAPRTFAGLDLAQAPDILVTTAGAVVLFPRAGPTLGAMPISWRVIGRLRDGEAASAVEARLAAVFGSRRDERAVLVPLETAALAATTRPAMQSFGRLLGGAVGLLLLVGCLTVGMLVLIRTEARRDEFSICLALGASRLRLARSVLLEGAWLAAAGGLASLPAAAWLLAALGALSVPGGITLEGIDLSVGVGSFVSALTCAVAATLVIALVGGLFGFRGSVGEVLRTRSGSTPRLTRRPVRAVLIAGQTAVSLVLVTGAALFARSLIAVLHVNPGFDTARLITGHVEVEADRYTPALAIPFFETLVDRLSRNRAILAVSLPASPSGMGAGGVLTIDGVDRTFQTEVVSREIDERFFSTIGLPLLAGRNFTARDDPRAPLVTIVSESFGRMIANGGRAIGSRIRSYHAPIGKPFPLITVVGVVPDVIADVGELRPLVMYRPVAQADEGPVSQRQLVARAAGDMARAEREIVATVRQVDPSLRPAPHVEVMTMDEQLTSQMGPQRLGARVLGALGSIALLLTTLGTYVLAESMAAVRRREMGIRAALGARGVNLAALVLGEAGRLVGVGLFVGLFIVWAQAATIRAFLLHTEPLDPASLLATAGLILMLTAAVSLRPAIAASRVDIVRVLRED